ncbi:MAG: rhodanese-like domain-containing protein [Rhodospirillaceae bacterium]|nr:rhodanese-like domain-containing protein [Rhodospirillaceae bacterium]
MRFVSGLVALVAAVSTGAAAVHAEGNRYGYPRDYHSDISPVAAYLAMQRADGTVMIDVRSVGEFAGGHAPQSYNIPYPRIAGANKDDPAYRAMSDADFLAEVERRFPDRATPIITMCQSGGRSALAANILAKAGYANVRSVWTGYLGRPLTDTNGAAVDANANGIIAGVTPGPDGGAPLADPGDMDGWAGFHQLPVSRAIDPERVLPALRALYPAAPE